MLNILAKFNLQIDLCLRRYTKSFAEAMAAALEKAEREEVQKQLEREAAEVDVSKLRKEKRLLKRRKWVDWEFEKKTEDAQNIANGDSKRIAFDPLTRVKRKKCAICVSYSGANFYGMQRNAGMPTIEDELLKVMLKHKWITDESYDQPQLACFQRAARTDKGVSALRQVCSIKLQNLDIAAFNMDLPPEIRLFAVERVTKGFNAKDQCNARTYTYTMPSVAFDCFTNKSPVETFRISDEKLLKVRNILKYYEGTKNFHNFTRKKSYIDPSVKRYIISIDCSEPFIANSYNLEFVTIKIKGQSFMMHQIRKMIGLVIAICRGHTDMSTMEKAFTDQKLDLPRAPGLGLVLDNVHYERYNDRYGSDGIHQPLTWLQTETEIKEFAEKKIYSKIYEIEHRERSMLDWLATLFKHTYDVRTDDNSLDTTTADDEDE